MRWLHERVHHGFPPPTKYAKSGTSELEPGAVAILTPDDRGELILKTPRSRDSGVR